LTTGSLDTYVGYQAHGSSGTTVSEIVIGANAVGLGSDTTVIGTNGTTTATTIYGTLSVAGIASSTAALNYACVNSSTKLFTYDGSGTCLVSLEDKKDIIGPLSSVESLGEVMKLKPIWAKIKDSETGTTHHDGGPMLGAHQVENVDKRLAAYDEKGKLASVKYEAGITSLLVSAMQQQQKEIEAISHNQPIVLGHRCFFGLLVCPND
jgi:hypothetical protein